MSPKVSMKSHPLRMSTRSCPFWRKVSTRCHCPRNVSILSFMVYICESCLTAIYQCAIALAPHIQQFEYFQSQYGALPCWGHHKNDNWPKKVQLITESYLRALEQCAIASHHTSSSSNIRAAVSVSVWSSSSQLSVVGTSKQAIHSSGLPDSRTLV